MWLCAPVTPELWGPEDRRVIGLAGCQTSFRERPCLKGIRQRVIEQDTQHPPLAFTYAHTGTHKIENGS